LKIFFTIDSLQTGGAEKSTLEIVRRLPDHIKPIVVCFYSKLDLLEQFQISGIQVECFHLKGKYNFKQARKVFAEYCIAEKPDLIVATLFRAEFISRLVAHKLNIPIIGTFVNDTYSKFEWQQMNVAMKCKIAFFWLLNKWSSRYCYRFLANSESIKWSNARALLINPSLIDVIPRGRELNKFTYSEERFKNEKITFLNVGRIIPRKGQFELVRAFAVLAAKHNNVQLLIAGDGSAMEALKLLVAESKMESNITLLGNVNNVPELLNCADVFVFPSWYEGFSGALVEAMIAGIPILASDIPMNKEAVTHLQDAYLFKVKSQESIIEALEFALANQVKMRSFAQSARNKAVASYDINSVAKQHADYYTRIIDAHSPTHTEKAAKRC
jgi:glycosyltransferase involved in cell wall biosynthesis